MFSLLITIALAIALVLMLIVGIAIIASAVVGEVHPAFALLGLAIVVSVLYCIALAK